MAEGLADAMTTSLSRCMWESLRQAMLSQAKPISARLRQANKLVTGAVLKEKRLAASDGPSQSEMD